MNVAHRIRLINGTEFLVETHTIDGDWLPSCGEPTDKETALENLRRIANNELRTVFVPEQEDGWTTYVAVAV